jgi:hypothetical protein
MPWSLRCLVTSFSERNRRHPTVARRHGATVAQVALAHLLALSPSTLAIPGTGPLAHLEENVAARSRPKTSRCCAERHRARQEKETAIMPERTRALVMTDATSGIGADKRSKRAALISRLQDHRGDPEQSRGRAPAARQREDKTMLRPVRPPA